MLSKSCIYGIRAVLYLALQEEEGYVSIRKISKDLDISFHFLTKILQQLTQNEILTSFRGPNGGVALAKPADQLDLVQIIEAIDGLGIFQECILGLPGCGSLEPCPLHDQWGKAREELYSAFKTLTIAQLATKTKNLNLRLVDQQVIQANL
ncbi:MAG: Rrf2 family transcriptional regulator [Gemmatimonadetes bacterium]|nr:MAG: Rrf2 family transcriptional regulator [Gemmatimonadota bacterium]